MKRIILISLFFGLSALQTSCSVSGDEPAFGVGGDTDTSVTGIVSQRNFFVQFASSTIDFYDPTDNVFTEQSTTIVVQAKDRSGGAVANATVNIRVNWGYLSSSTCVTDTTGECSVTYTTGNSSNVPIDYTYPVVDLGGPGPYTTDNFRTTVVVFTTGEEAFTDDNSNGTYDDGEVFIDQTEPYFERGTSDATWLAAGLISAATSGLSFDAANTPLNASLLRGHVDDSTGIDRVINGTGSHLDVTTTDTADAADGEYNGASCTHSTLCSATTSTVIWDISYIDLTKD